MPTLTTLFQSHAELVGNTLEALLDKTLGEHERNRPHELLKAMRYSALNGGKRIRPFLVIESAKMFGVSPETSVRAACALECIHCYSLIHDDLPAMDDDDLRRGKPTNHKIFGEAKAILAGDALLTISFDILADRKTHADGEVRANLVQLFAQSAGIGGMAGGQALDIDAETKTLTASEITMLQSMKTGALIRCACLAGAILGKATEEQQNALLHFGNQIGNAFQLSDDILDETSNTEKLGKLAGKDQNQGKATLVALYGLDKSRELMQTIYLHALEGLEDFGAEADILRETARFIVERDH